MNVNSVNNNQVSFQGRVFANPKNLPQSVNENLFAIKMIMEPKPYNVKITYKDNAKKELSYLFTNEAKKLVKHEYIIQDGDRYVLKQFFESMESFDEKLLTPIQRVYNSFRNAICKYILKI